MKMLELKATTVVAPEGRLFRLFPDNASALAWVTADEPGNPSARSDQVSGALPWWFHNKTASPAGAR